MRHLVRDVSRVLTLFLVSRQAWPKILGGGEVSMFGENFPLPPKGAWIKHWANIVVKNVDPRCRPTRGADQAVNVGLCIGGLTN